MQSKTERIDDPGDNCILVVDDDSGVRQTLEWALQDEGFAVVTAADGREALQLVAERSPDLILLDMAMPVLDGFGFSSALRQRHGDGIPIVVLTADGRAAQKAARVGAVDYLRKPFDLDELVARVWNGLATG